MFKEETIIIQNKKYILKKHSDFWINFWILFCVFSFCVGGLVGSNLISQKANQFKIDTIKEIRESKYYQNIPEEQKNNINIILNEKLIEIKNAK